MCVYVYMMILMFYSCGKDTWKEGCHPNKSVSVQYSSVNYGHSVAQQISRI